MFRRDIERVVLSCKEKVKSAVRLELINKMEGASEQKAPYEFGVERKHSARWISHLLIHSKKETSTSTERPTLLQEPLPKKCRPDVVALELPV